MRGEVLEISTFEEGLMDFKLGGVEGEVVSISRSTKAQPAPLGVNRADDAVE